MKKDQQLPTVFEVAEILVTEQDQGAILPRFLSYLISTLDVADTGILLLHDETDGQLVASAAQGYDFDTSHLTVYMQRRVSNESRLVGHWSNAF